MENMNWARSDFNKSSLAGDAKREYFEILYAFFDSEKWSQLNEKQKTVLRKEYQDGKMTDYQIEHMRKIQWEDEKDIKRYEFTMEEEAFRRGYRHGVLAASKGVTVAEAYAWSSNGGCTCPPGTHLAGSFIPEENLCKKKP